MATIRPHLNPTRWPARPRYTPIDELLQMPRVRILRTLLHFDWASGEDVNLALDNLDERAANTHTSCLSRLVREGFVDRKGKWKWRSSSPQSVGGYDPNYTRYRITAAGREHLRELLGRAVIGDSEAAAS